jgi:uncharacterized protein (DUF4415 family)
MAKSKIKYGKKDVLPPGEFDPKKSKVRISLFVDGDVLMAFKEAAKGTSHGEYQTLMREKLRESIFGKQIDPALRETIREVLMEEMKKAS